ncbi:hypothetical protein [Paractinoplanes toevensis]|uniref:Uncharacterized protein n=1 Tax=Paractinoplanes toevensis TaxID=571911 RepID=A0A919T5K0_9ACTN|nr:hypothetical protein [Actinoplanes toevensis]GIM88767.1 hypothetical protein Ato02nite_005600 [Actinoplanes toevensis]
MRVEDQHRFEVYGAGDETYGAVVIKCRYCADWQYEYDTTVEAFQLADLIDAAAEHPDCRRKP